MSEWLGMSGQAPWWGCQCTSDGGKKLWAESADPDVWIHPACGLPSAATLEADVLNLMRGGDHHNTIVETHDLTHDGQYSWIGDYVWTPEKIVGSQSGREARVWVHKDHPSLSTPS